MGWIYILLQQIGMSEVLVIISFFLGLHLAVPNFVRFQNVHRMFSSACITPFFVLVKPSSFSLGSYFLLELFNWVGWALSPSTPLAPNSRSRKGSHGQSMDLKLPKPRTHKNFDFQGNSCMPRTFIFWYTSILKNYGYSKYFIDAKFSVQSIFRKN